MQGRKISYRPSCRTILAQAGAEQRVLRLLSTSKLPLHKSFWGFPCRIADVSVLVSSSPPLHPAFCFSLGLRFFGVAERRGGRGRGWRDSDAHRRHDTPKAAGVDAKALGGKKLRVRGWVERRNGP